MNACPPSFHSALPHGRPLTRGAAKRPFRHASRPWRVALVAGALALTAMAQARGPAPGAPNIGSSAAVPAGSDGPDSTEAVAAFGPKRLVETYMAKGPGSTPISLTLQTTALDTSTVNCPGTNLCTIGLESMVQIHPLGGNWSICLKIDNIAPSCQLQGTWGQGGNGIVVGNARGALQNLLPGLHTVSTEVFLQNTPTQLNPATVYNFHTDYRIYKQ